MSAASVDVLVRFVREGSRELAPAYQTAHSAGMDLRADIDSDLTILPGNRVLVQTGLSLAIPDGFEGQVRSRSGMALRDGVMCLNSPGTIDADYRGEVKVILANLGQTHVTIRRGDRIAQIVFAPVARARFTEVDLLPETDRGDGGFGSTGKQ